jgi:BASS family bile acid:Na+ symporter
LLEVIQKRRVTKLFFKRRINLKDLLRSRNLILILALIMGLLWGKGAQWTEEATLPALAIVMTLSTMGIPGSAFRSFRAFLALAMSGIVMNYLLLGSILLGLNALLIHDEALRAGFVIIAAVPPAVAVIPFTFFLNGDGKLSLFGTIGAYLGALMIMPLMALGFLGSGLVDPSKLIVIMIELILAPLIVSRVLVWIGMGSRLEPIKGAITNWSFFLLTYTIVGLNRELILYRPLSLLPVAIIAITSTFLLGWAIEAIGRLFRVLPKTLTSLLLLGTLKNYGLAGGLALALFSKETSVPATVSTVFMIVYIIWLQFKRRRVN